MSEQARLWRINNKERHNELKRLYNLRKKISKLSNIKHEQHVILYCRVLGNESKKLNKLLISKNDQHVIEFKRDDARFARWRSNHDMEYVVYQRLKRGIQRALKVNDRSDWMQMLGYTAKDLMIHIESQFTFGMSWDNKHEWCIDHIKPLCSYNITSIDSQEFKECFALNNLQPLWRHHNVIKYHTHDKYLKAS